MQTRRAEQTQSINRTDRCGTTPAKAPHILLMKLPDAQHFGPEYGISYAQSRLAQLGVKVDRSFKIEPYLDTRPDAQGVRWVTYTLRAEMSPAQAKSARQLGFWAE